MEYVTLELVKKHLNVEEAFSDDDKYITMLADVAEAKVSKELCIGVEELATIGGGKEIPPPLVQAILLSIGLYYANREEVTYVQTKPLEQGVKYLVSLYRDYTK